MVALVFQVSVTDLVLRFLVALQLMISKNCQTLWLVHIPSADFKFLNDFSALKAARSNKDREKTWGLTCLFYPYKRHSAPVGPVTLTASRSFLAGSDKCNKVKHGSLI